MDHKTLLKKLKLSIQLMELHDENPFRIRSYQNALTTLERGDQDIMSLSEAELGKIPGIGKGMLEVIDSLIKTESFPALDELLEKTPEGILEVLQIKGLGPKKVKTLSREKEIFLTHIETNKGIIYKVANSYCKDQDDREDLIQEIILQLWKAWPSFQPDYKLSTWMYRIALNVSISAYRKASKRSLLQQPLNETVIYLQEEQSVELDKRDVLQAMIRELKEVDRALILLYLEGYIYPEIAEVLGISESNVATKLSRIKQQLKKKITAQ